MRVTPTSPARALSYTGSLLCLIALLCGLSLGRADLGLAELGLAFSEGPWSARPSAVILWWVRLPQTLTALLSGAALGASGAALQSLLRNPLADPYLLGVSSGGGLGAALAFVSGAILSLGLWVLPVASFLGALSSCALIYAWARHEHHLSLERLILIGVALNLLLSALLTLTLAFSEEQLQVEFWRWLLGRVDGLSWSEVSWLTLTSTVGGLSLIKSRRALWLLEGGEELAWSLGVDVERVKRRALWATALAVGGVVAFCGIIGFVGLMAPHYVRPRLSGESQLLVPLSALYGAGGLALCEGLGRLASPPLPLGVITGCIGGLFFLIALGAQRDAHLY